MYLLCVCIFAHAHLPHLFITGLNAVVLTSWIVGQLSLSSLDSVSVFPALVKPVVHMHKRTQLSVNYINSTQTYTKNVFNNFLFCISVCS